MLIKIQPLYIKTNKNFGLSSDSCRSHSIIIGHFFFADNFILMTFFSLNLTFQSYVMCIISACIGKYNYIIFYLFLNYHVILSITKYWPIVYFTKRAFICENVDENQSTVLCTKTNTKFWVVLKFFSLRILYLVYAVHSVNIGHFYALENLYCPKWL